MAKSKFLKLFKERGFFHQCTDEDSLDKTLYNAEPEQGGKGIATYIGFDCTATSLHVGSLMQIMVLRWLKKLGHNPIILLGGATTKIGDPSGKDESRPKISDEIIAENMNGIRNIFNQFGLQDATLVNNADWYQDFLLNIMNISEHFSINRMLTFDSVKLRLEREHHLSLKEFLYMVLQAYDFALLNKTHGCRLQIGGSDQWGNIVNGVELHRRQDGSRNNEVADNSIFGLTTPLITTSSGAKMGKTAQGAVWLSADKLSPYDYWQFWRNTEDQDVWRFMRLFTDIEIEEIARMEQQMQGAAINDAKIVLANEATKICHGENAASHAAETARKVFEQGGIGEDLPKVEIQKSELEAGIPAFKILHMANLVESGGEAKRLIKGGGARINDHKINNEAQNVTLADLNQEGIIKLSAGKKKHAVIQVV